MNRARFRAARLFGVTVLGLGLLSTSAFAASDDDVARAQNEISAVGREVGSVQTAIDKAKSERLTVEQRLANGELLYRSKDYERATVVLSEIIEGYPDTPSYVDALWLRGETFYTSGEYLSARRDYRAIVKHGNEPRYASYVGKALARLVDVCIRIGDIDSLDEVFQNLGLVPSGQADAALTYAKGKAYYAKKSYGDAKAQFAAVPANTAFTHQARYFLGLVAMKEAQAQSSAPAAAGAPAGTGKYKAAIDVFKQVTDLPPDTDEHRHVIDLAWMAIGRLAYEIEQFQLAAESYLKVGRESPEFDTMLYETAWVYVRLGDVQRAERALEVLSIADPDSSYLADGTLLRADLLLRAGAFDKALQLYTTVRGQYDPMRSKVESFLDSNKDVAAYYDKLSLQEMEALDQSEALPPVAIKWAREAEDGPMAFAVIDDVNQCKKLIHDSEILIEKLNALTGASNRVRAFPELLAGQQLAVGLQNRLSRARLDLAKGLDAQEPAELGGEIGQVRADRRKLMGDIATLPTTSGEFDARDQIGVRQWNDTSQKLSQANLAIDQLQAVVNGLRRVLKEDAQHGVARDPEALKRFNDEIDANEKLLKQHREEVAVLRRQIEVGRAQIGLGDSSYQQDRENRDNFRTLLEREAQLASSGQAGSAAQVYGQRITGLLAQTRAEEDQLASAFATLEKQVEARTTELKAKIDTEAANIANYKGQLDKLDTEGRDLVGHVAERNFQMVRDKLRNIVLRADVGITEQAWEVREEELDRVRNLQTERAREEQLLDEELREVLDDANDTGDKAPPQK
ncbi:MAG TPA: tetratricopeptide repeat protein [Polyangiaceae bacterium]